MEPLGPEDPSKVGPFLLTARLGIGGMGEVFLGRTPGGRAVAVKRIRKELADRPTVRQRFRQEIEAARSVSGFYTAPVVDADPEGSPPWLATAYVPGASLEAVLAEYGRPLPERTVRVLGAGLAEALAAVHRQGLVHRDLKPANILLSGDGVRVIDFGIVKAAHASGETGLTQHGSVVGTHGYIAPEQYEGQISPAGDVYAFGTILAKAAGYDPPPDGPPPEPGSLWHLISRCRRPDPALRPSVREILKELTDDSTPTHWLPPAVQTLISTVTVPDSDKLTIISDAPQSAPARRGPGDPRAGGPEGVITFEARVDLGAPLARALACLAAAAGICTVAGLMWRGIGGVPSAPASLALGGLAFAAVGCLTAFALMLTRTITRTDGSPHRLRVGTGRLEVESGRRRSGFAWEEIDEITVLRRRGGPHLAARLAPGSPSPPRGGWPRLDRGTGWALITPMRNFSSSAVVIEQTVADSAGPRWAPPTR